MKRGGRWGVGYKFRGKVADFSDKICKPQNSRGTGAVGQGLQVTDFYFY